MPILKSGWSKISFKDNPKQTINSEEEKERIRFPAHWSFSYVKVGWPNLKRCVSVLVFVNTVMKSRVVFDNTEILL